MRDFDQVTQSMARIDMRMNPNDQNYSALHEVMRLCIRAENDENGRDALGKFADLAKIILKREKRMLKM